METVMAWMCSADSHVIEPGDVWTSRVPAALKERAPRYERRDDVLMTVVDGRDTVAIPVQAFALADGTTLPPDDVPGRLELLDKDGVWAEALIGNLAGTVVFGIEEPEFAMACARAYNDWLAETFVPYGDRQVGIAFIPSSVEPAAATAEIERVHAMGLRGITMPLWPTEPYFLEKFEPIWDTAAGLGLPLSFHSGTGSFFKKIFLEENNQESFIANAGAMEPRYRDAVKTAGGMGECPPQGYQAYQVTAWLVGAGILDRYSDLQIAFIECGAGWMVSALGWLDFVWQGWPTQDRTDGLTGDFDAFAAGSWSYDLRPSEYVHRQIHATFQDEPAAIEYRHQIGIEQLMWGSDFPHPEGTWPRSKEFVEARFAGVEPAEREAILSTNFAKLYGVEVPVMA
jgi:predicted TIM-barrel fold metal-dependent hydrolase